MPAYLDGRLEEAVAAGRHEKALAEEVGRRGVGARYQWPYRYSGLIAEGSDLFRRGSPGHMLVPALAELGQREEAEQILQRSLPAGRLADQGAAATIVELVNLLEGAVLLEDRESAATLARYLTGAAGSAYYGPCPARMLGAAAALLGEREQAMAYYEQALEVCERVRFRPEIALTHLQMAELLLDSGFVGARHAWPLQTREEALTHLDFAIAEFRAMKMQPALERALRHKEVLKA